MSWTLQNRVLASLGGKKKEKSKAVPVTAHGGP
jgi:hypothetical protein